MDGNQSTIKFNPEVNLGQIIAGLSLIATFCTMLWWQSSFQTATIEQFKSVNEKFISAEAVSASIRGKYIPMIETVSGAQNVTNDRLQNVGLSLREIRDELREFSGKLSSLESRIIKLEVTVANSNSKVMGMNVK